MTGPGARAARLRRWARVRVWLLPCLLMFAAGWPALFGEKWQSDAGLYTLVSAKMLERGDWWTLSDGYGFYFNKPPLAFWVRGAMIRLFGLEASWATRLPDVLAAIGIVWALADIVRRLHGRRTAMLSGLVMASTVHFAYFVPALKLDFLQTLFMLLAVREAVVGVRSGRGWRIALGGVWVGLALLTKPISALLVPPLVGAWIVLGTDRRAMAWWTVPMLAAALAVAAPWHVSMMATHGELFTDQYFGQQMVKRATGAMGVDRPWMYYFKKLVDVYWPWLAVVVAAGVSWAAGHARPRGRAGTALMLLWTIGWFAALTAFKGKGRYYLICVYPGLAWVCGAWLARVMPRVGWRVLNRFGAAAAGGALAVSLVWAPIREPREHRIGPGHTGLIEFVRATEEPIWNEGLEPWSVWIVFAKTGELFRAADDRPVARWGVRRGPAPAGALAAAVFDPKRPPQGEIVMRSEGLVVYRKPTGGVGSRPG